MRPDCFKIIFSILMVIVAGATSFAAVRKPVITPAGNVIIADWSKDSWSVGGKKTSSPTGAVDTKTPDGKPAITFSNDILYVFV